jgi:hypothetical protein
MNNDTDTLNSLIYEILDEPIEIRRSIGPTWKCEYYDDVDSGYMTDEDLEEVFTITWVNNHGMYKVEIDSIYRAGCAAYHGKNDKTTREKIIIFEICVQ